MKNYILFSLLLCICLLESCSKDADNNDPKKEYVKGKNRFTLLIDGDEREFFVHVPSGYTGNTSVEVVFMLHGTSGNGEEFYDKSGWKEVGELNNVITVFPSSWRYCIFTGGEQKVTTKWNSQPADWTFCAGQKPRDDIHFLKSIIQSLNAKFNINNKKIYLVGFSNGGQMAA